MVDREEMRRYNKNTNVINSYKEREFLRAMISHNLREHGPLYISPIQNTLMIGQNLLRLGVLI